MSKGFRRIYLKSAKYHRKMGFYFGGQGNMGLGGFLRILGVKMRFFKKKACKGTVILTLG
jgi:hypothetical protein